MIIEKAVNFEQFNEKKTFVEASLSFILNSANEAIETKGFFNIVLSGGDTSLPVYEALSKLHTNWDKWNFWFSDERCVKEDSPDLTVNMLQKTLFNIIPISKKQVHEIPVSKGSKDAACLYAAEIETVKVFDLVLLGIGSDGHTASLFPDLYKQKKNEPSVIPVFNSPKLPSERVSLTIQRINRSKKILFLASGSNKQDIVIRFRNRKNMPATLVCAKNNTTMYFYLQS